MKSSQLTNKKLSELLPQELLKASNMHQEGGNLLLKAWKEFVGEQISSKTKAVSFKQGRLLVHVADSTLYAILSREEKPKLLKNLKKRFPKVQIKDLIFRYGTIYDGTRRE